MAFTGKLADFFVELGLLDHTGAGLNQVKGKLTSWLGGMSKAMAIPVSIFTTVGGAAAAKFLYDAAQKASNLNETLSKTGQVFGDATGRVTAYADRMAASFGVVKTELLDATSMFGLILQGAGMAQSATAGLSVKLAQAAVDASSFYNVSVGTALEKMRAGLAGEAEPLRGFGVMLSEGAVKTRIQSKGGDVDSESAKVAARAELIFEGLKKSSGDLERTFGGLANQQRALQGAWENFQATFGTELIPVGGELIKLLKDLGTAFTGALGSTTDAAKVLAGALGGAAQSLRSGVISGGVGDMVGETIETIGVEIQKAWGRDGGYWEKRLRERLGNRARGLAEVDAANKAAAEQEATAKKNIEQAVARAAAKEGPTFQERTAGVEDLGDPFLNELAQVRSNSVKKTLGEMLRGMRGKSSTEGLASLFDVGNPAGGLPSLADLWIGQQAGAGARPFQAQAFQGVGSAMDALQMDVLNTDKEKERTEIAKKQVEKLEKIGGDVAALAGMAKAGIRGLFPAIARGPE